MRTPYLRWQLAATGAAGVLHGRPIHGWRAALTALRPPVWPAVIAVLVGIGLLLAFQQVVARVVEQAEQQRMTAAAQHEAVWRCKLLRQPRNRADCLAQLAGAPALVSLHGRDVLAAMAASPVEPGGRHAALTLPSLVQPLEK